MNTKKAIMAAAAVALGLTAGTASADAFNGFYVGTGLAVNKMSGELVSTYSANYNGDLYSDSDSGSVGGDKHNAALNLSAGYAMSFGQFNLAGELSYQTSYGKATPYAYSYSSNGYSYSESLKIELTKGVAISILPGYKVGKDTLVYGRLGYVRAKAKSAYSESDNEGYSYSENDSTKVSGIQYGIGVKHAFTPKLSAVLEYQAVNFKKKTILSESDSGDGWTESYKETIQPSSNGVLMGMQYAF